MGDIRSPEKALTFAGIMVPLRTGFIEDWTPFSGFGSIVSRSDMIDFSSITDYYDDEMGEPIGKYYVYTDRLMIPSELSEMKVRSNEIEEKFMVKGNRKVNFDVGYISLANLVLASTKNFFHRVYLDKGIYGEVTLYYRDKELHELPWTYRDYRREDTQAFIMEAREYLKRRLKT